MVAAQTKAVRKKRKAYSIKKWYEGYLYILPWIIGFLVFQLYPLLSSAGYSFTSFSLMKAPKFIGLTNYIRMFQSPIFYTSLGVTFAYVIFSVPLKLAFALIIALVLNMKLKGIGLYRTVYYIPSIFGGSVAISILWKGMFMHDGIVNKVFAIVGIPAVDWFGSGSTALGTLIVLSVWEFGSSMVLFLAGLKQIPNELYEAAKVDGSSAVHSFFKITLPMLSPIIFFNLIMQMINAFQEFTGAFVITNGGPSNGTYLYGMLLYDYAFRYFKMGYASALSWVLFAIILLFTFILFKTSKYWTFYQDGGEQ